MIIFTIVHFRLFEIRYYRRTDQPTNRPTNQLTDNAMYRAAITAKKKCQSSFKISEHGDHNNTAFLVFHNSNILIL